MAISAFAKSRFEKVNNSEFSRAKKLADLALKTTVDNGGNPTSNGYEQAISILQPFVLSGNGADSLSAQQAIAGYTNSLTKLNKKERDQNETVSAFKLQELDSYFTSFDGDTASFRNPSSLINATSDSLDSLVVGVINAIDQKEANGDSTDQLYSYLNDLNKRADAIRDLKNKFQSGELTGKSLDGYGYFVDTNPVDGSVRSAAILPIGITPDGLSKGYKRLDATTNISGAYLPVYAPAVQTDSGDYVSKVGNYTWKGLSNDTTLSSEGNSKVFTNGGFDIKDINSFPSRKGTIDSGSFGRGFIGRDDSGNPVESIFYRGVDGKLYSLDNNSLDKLKQDPILGKKLDGYIPQFSPSEIKDISRESVPIDDTRINRESDITGLKAQAVVAQNEADKLNNRGFFENLISGLSDVAEKSKSSVGGPTPSFFDNKNRPNKPDQTSTGGTAEGIIDTGKKIFRTAAGFFSR